LKKIIIFCLSFLALNAAAYCGQVNKIELSDGTVINGEIVSFANGVYTIRTLALGEIKVGALRVSKIESLNRSLTNTPDASVASPSNLTPSQIDSYKQRLLDNPESAAIVTGLSTDPQIQELAKDPQIADAAKAGDIQALMKNKKFMSIVNDSRIQEEIKKIKQ